MKKITSAIASLAFAAGLTVSVCAEKNKCERGKATRRAKIFYFFDNEQRGRSQRI